MPSFREMKQRISGVSNIQQITRAMKMVAGARLRRAESTILALRPFASRLDGMVARYLGEAAGSEHPYFQEREAGVTALLVLSSDRGLCGSFNNRIVAGAREIVADRGDRITEVFTVVEDEQCLTRVECSSDLVDRSRRIVERDAQGRGDGGCDPVGRGDRRQVDEPDAVAEPLPQRRRDLDGEARLAHPAGSGQRRQAVFGEQGPQVLAVVAASDEAGQERRQVAGCALADGVECRVLQEDLFVESDQRLRRLDPELLDETVADVAEGPQCVGLAAGPVERSHQQRSDPLARWWDNSPNTAAPGRSGLPAARASASGW